MTFLKNSITEYSESEFLNFIELICDNDLTEKEEDALIRHFAKVVHHPSGTDLIFWPKEGDDDSPEGILLEIKRWYAEQGLPCFKPE
ncbi:bacteriocin immunity protein [Photobacterium sp. 1_MG-2023]|uniref:bacteriocin immunity protein n=1 Tax=Photobacterium sp. 1_MG-2023 TaxID=3062646 RepID=UPI0026E2C6BA|nr:bacteriocin immunity protein [Photobacterium sp. 1_MG-2023]MDO6709075.1 bacteriocin immunity protein [Photobacterium sp. 1_MG-2023]